ncbi:hypothetical protein BC826DRAFT_1011265, partial [Russula brevipes]
MHHASSIDGRALFCLSLIRPPVLSMCYTIVSLTSNESLSLFSPFEFPVPCITTHMLFTPCPVPSQL